MMRVYCNYFLRDGGCGGAVKREAPEDVMVDELMISPNMEGMV